MVRKRTCLRHPSRLGPMLSTSGKEKAKIAAGAATAVIMTAVLFVIALAFLLPQ